MVFVFGKHGRMRELERRIGFITRSRQPVLIEGACGTGKEALVELLHQLTGANTTLVRILCRRSDSVVYPTNLQVNGVAHLGEICRSVPGTVLLKNVHLLPPLEQEQVLVALEEAAHSHDGNDEWGAAKRLVSTATESLGPLVGRGEFSRALYHRLSVYRICLPPLRERLDDIPELFAQMTRRAGNGSGPAPPATARLMEALRAYEWPGNLRELQNIARTYVAGARPDEIIAELENRSRQASVDLPANGGRRSLKEQVKGASQKLESEIILRALERHRWNRRRAAETLQISYRSLLYKMKSCNLRSQPEGEPEGRRDL